MKRSPFQVSVSRVLTAFCVVAAASTFPLAVLHAQDAKPAVGGKHRNAQPSGTPLPSSALIPTGVSPAPTNVKPFPAAADSTKITGQDIDEINEPSPPTDKGMVDEADTPTTQTEIIATQGATFASKDRIAVFTGEVRVHDPKFQLSSDKLTVFLNKTDKTGDKTASAAATPAASTPAPLSTAGSTPPAPAPKQSSGGIDHAVAEGHVIIIQERAATDGGEAKRSVGRADWASFDNKSGDMVLKGTPSVEQNGNTHVATSPDTVMTLRRDNSLLTVGPSRTLITQRSKGGDLGFGPTAPAASPAPANKPPRPSR